MFPGRKFTLDGLLVGNLVEVLAEYMFDLDLVRGSNTGHDAKTRSRRLEHGAFGAKTNAPISKSLSHVDAVAKAALSSVKGFYLVSDVTTGKHYVGSAYGDQGIWSRWSAYIDSGHGGNVELCELVSDPTLDYCRKAFRFA